MKLGLGISAQSYAGCQLYADAVRRAGTLDADRVRDLLLTPPWHQR